MTIGFREKARIPLLATLLAVPSFPNSPPPAGGTNFVTAMQTMLASTGGWVTDPGDASINFTDTGGTTPVTTPGVSTIARFNSKFGITTYNWQQATVANQYLWNGASMGCDGVDDILQTTAWAGLNGATALTATFRAQLDDLSVARMIFSCSTSTGTNGRYQLGVNANGSISLYLRRTDAEAQQAFTTAATGLITTGVPFTIQTRTNYLNGAVEIFLNGTSVFSGTHTGTDGVNGVDATNSARCRWGLNTSNTLTDWFRNKIGAAVWHLAVADATQLANARGFVERNAL